MKSRTNITLPSALLTRLRLRAEQDGTRLSWLIEGIVQEHLDGCHTIRRYCRRCRRMLPLEAFPASTKRCLCLDCLPRCVVCGGTVVARDRTTCSPECARAARGGGCGLTTLASVIRVTL